MAVAARAYVRAHGRIVLEGRTADLRAHHVLNAASFDGDTDAAAELAPGTGIPTKNPKRRGRARPGRDRPPNNKE
jgi:hypothetical protein